MVYMSLYAINRDSFQENLKKFWTALNFYRFFYVYVLHISKALCSMTSCLRFYGQKLFQYLENKMKMNTFLFVDNIFSKPKLRQCLLSDELLHYIECVRFI